MSTSPVSRVAVLYPGRLHADGVGDRSLERLQQRHPRVEFIRTTYDVRSAQTVGGVATEPDELLHGALAQADAVLCLDLPDHVLELAPRLRWVQSVATGIDTLPLRALRGAGVRLTNAAGTAAPEIAEFVLARILEHRKRLPELAALAANRDWVPLYGGPLTQLTLGLVGFGAINQQVAHLAGAFGMEVHVCRRNISELPVGVRQVYGADDLHVLLGRSDIVVSAVPEVPDTTALFDHAAFSAMREGTFFINVGRGSAVDESALMTAVQSGQLSGAALDVVGTEPLAADDTLWSVPGIRISAHCSSAPGVTIERVVDLFSENLRRLDAGMSLLNQK